MGDKLRAIPARLGIGPHLLLGIIALTLVVVVLLADYTGLLVSPFVDAGKRDVTAVFRDAKQLRKGDKVRVRGVDVGEVKDIAPGPGARTVKVKMTVDESAGTIHRDARAQVLWRSLLGGNFYVAVDPGHRGTLGSDPIPAAHTGTQTELDDITTVLQPDATQGTKHMLPELAKALGDRQQPALVLRALGDNAPDIARGVGAVRGVQPDVDVRRLVSTTDRTVQALDTPNESLRGVVEGAAATLETTANRRVDIEETLGRAAGVMRRTDTTLSDLDTTLKLAHPLVDKLRPPASDVAPTLARLHPVAVGADHLLTKAKPLLRDLRPAVNSLASASRTGVPLLTSLSPSLRRLDKTILPYINEKDPVTEHTTAEMVGPGAGGLALAGASIDSNGHFLRFPASSGSAPVYLPCNAYINQPDKAGQLLDCKSLNQIFDDYLNYNPFGSPKGTTPAPLSTSAPAGAKKAGSG